MWKASFLKYIFDDCYLRVVKNNFKKEYDVQGRQCTAFKTEYLILRGFYYLQISIYIYYTHVLYFCMLSFFEMLVQR